VDPQEPLPKASICPFALVGLLLLVIPLLAVTMFG
jgi:hypothetical protein